MLEADYPVLHGRFLARKESTVNNFGDERQPLLRTFNEHVNERTKERALNTTKAKHYKTLNFEQQAQLQGMTITGSIVSQENAKLFGSLTQATADRAQSDKSNEAKTDKKKQDAKSNSGSKKQSIFNNIINIIRGTPRAAQPVKKILPAKAPDEELSEEQMVQRIVFEKLQFPMIRSEEYLTVTIPMSRNF